MSTTPAARRPRLYVASSWRNQHYTTVLAALRAEGFDCYDFRNPAPGNAGFAWSQIDPNWQQWSPAQFRAALDHPIARGGFALDEAELRACDACVLVMPCGRSAHLEAGFAMGAGKPVVVYIPEPCEPELMYGLGGGIALTLEEITARLRDLAVPADVAALASMFPRPWHFSYALRSGNRAEVRCESEQKARAHYLDALHGTAEFQEYPVRYASITDPNGMLVAWFRFDDANCLQQYPEPAMQPAAEPFADAPDLDAPELIEHAPGIHTRPTPAPKANAQ